MLKLSIFDILTEAKQLTPDDFDIEIFDIPKEPFVIKHWYDGSIIYSSDTAKTIKEAVEEAVRKRVSLIWADLRDANLQEANLIGANLRFADLCGANLRCADLNYVAFSGADLRFADLCGAKFSISREELTRTTYHFNNAVVDDTTQFSVPLHEAKAIDLDDIEWGYYDPKKDLTDDQLYTIRALVNNADPKEEVYNVIQYIVHNQDSLSDEDIIDYIKNNFHSYIGWFENLGHAYRRLNIYKRAINKVLLNI